MQPKRSPEVVKGFTVPKPCEVAQKKTTQISPVVLNSSSNLLPALAGHPEGFF